MTLLNIAVAFLAGIASFASPCCLPLVPAYLSYLLGTTPVESPIARRIAIRQAVVFVLGFTIVFVSLWASVGLIGYALRDFTVILRQIGGAVLIILGLHVAGIIRISTLYRQFSVPVGRMGGAQDSASGAVTILAPSYRRSLLFGMAFAAAWTPCIGPILGGIIGLASLSASLGQGTVLLVVYSLGLGVPFILVAAGASEVNRRLGWFRKHNAGVSLVTGAILILVGFLMISNLFIKLSGFLPNLGL